MQDREDNQQGAPKKRRRRYSDQEKAAALVLLRSNSGLDSPLTATANQLQIPDSNLDAWRKGRGVSEYALKLVEQESKTLADIFRDVATLGAMEMRERLSDPDARSMMQSSDLVRITGMSADKAQLLSGAPTAITAHRDEAAIAELRKEADEALQEALIACAGDRDAAIALIRECAPTLSEYVN